jgi:hypothetical protein
MLRDKHGLRGFGNSVLGRIFVPKTDEMTVEQRKLHNQELCNLYSSPNIIRMIKKRRMRRAGHLVQMGRQGRMYVVDGKARRGDTTRKTKM